MMSRRTARALLALLLAIAVLGWPTGAQALGTVDQLQATANGSIVMPPGVAQTFTVGRTGLLDGVTLLSPSGGRVALQVYSLRQDGTPDITRPRMASNQQAVLLAGTQADIPLPPFPVVSGEQLALAVGVLNPLYTTASLATSSGDPYSRGQLFSVPGVYTFIPVPGVDLRFATHVTPAQIPTALAVSSLAASGGRPTAVLTAAGVPLPGKTITFELQRSGGRVKSRCSATTDSAGRAVCTDVRWVVPAEGSLVARFAGDAAYAPSTALATS